MIENELNITETMNDWLDKIKPIYDLNNKYDKTDIDNISTNMPITTSLDLLTDADETTIEQNNINDIQSISGTNDTSSSDGDMNFNDSSTTFSYKESLFENITSTSQSLSYLKNINPNILYFTGILFQRIQFDDKYWLNGFEFEALNDGWIKIGVFILSNYLIYYFKLILKYNFKDC